MAAETRNRPITEPTGIGPKDDRSPLEFAVAVTSVVAASWVPVLVGATTHASLGWGATVALAALIAWFTRGLGPVVLATGLVVSSALVPSGLVTESTHYMPVAVSGGALILRVGLDLRHRGLPQLPARPVVALVGLYLLWAALATLTSIDRKTSGVYLVGMVVVCALAFWFVPAYMAGRLDRERFLVALGVLGAVVAISVYLVSIFGAPTVFGHSSGIHRLLEVTVAGKPTGLQFAYSSGVFLAPLEPSVLMAVAIVALLGWGWVRPGRNAGFAWAAIVFMIPAILLTLDRSAWLAATVGGAAFIVLARFAKMRLGAAPFVFVFFGAWFLLVLVNLVGASTIASGCTGSCTVQDQESTIRGGTGLSGREYLWRASAEAIKHRPVQGYGPGMDVQAIDPYLSSNAVQAGYSLGGLTSHSTWLRTGVEMGVPGLFFLIGCLIAVGAVFLRAGLASRQLWDPPRIAVAAAVCSLLPAMTFESFLLGGLTFSSLILAIGLGLMAQPFTQTAFEARG